MRTELSYNEIDYVFEIDPKDPSGNGCIREIILCDEYELSRFMDSRHTILDIGANCGIATTILAKQNPNAQLFAFEPHPPTYDLLLENIRLNSVSNVTALNCAVGSSQRTKALLYLHPEFSGGNTICSSAEPFEAFHRAPALAIEVPCVSLDSFIEQRRIEQVDLLKIDCEGSEFEILFQSDQFRKGLVRNMVGEFHDLVYCCDVNETSADLLTYCNKHVDGIKKISILKL